MTTPSSDPERDTQSGRALAPLVRVQAANRAQLTAQATAIATAAAAAFTGWYDASAITAWATALAARIEGLQRAQAQSTDAYLARALSQLVGKRVRPVGRIDVAALRQGVTHAGAYGRAADTYRWQQSQWDNFARQGLDTATEPPDLVTPVDAAVSRAVSVAGMDIQLADRAQSQQVLTEHADTLDIRGYRRVIHPELSKGGTCGLCIAASDRIYHVKDLRAVHDRCECTTLPVIGSLDPGSGLNNLDLRTLYGHAGGTTDGAALKRTRYQIDEHGELGPVLTFQDQKFRTARQAADDANGPRPAKTAAEKQARIDRVRKSLIDALPRAQQLNGDDPTKWGNYLTQLEARIADLEHQLAAA